MAALRDLPAPTKQELKVPAALQSQGAPSTMRETVATTVKGVTPEMEAAARREELNKQEPVAEIKQEEVAQLQELPTTPEPTKEPEADPWEPLKVAFKDRLPTEVLNEYETLKREREEFRIQKEEREIAAKELQERLIAYDAKNDPDYRTHVINPVEEAKQLLLGVCLEDPELYKEAFTLQMDKNLEPKERAAKLNTFFTENSISKYDWDRGFRALKTTYDAAQDYEKNYQQIRSQKDQERVKSMEMQAQQNQNNIRQVHRTAAFKAEAELKTLGADFLVGVEDVRNEHLLGLEKALSGAGYDQEQEVKNNLFGRLLLKNLPEIQAKLKKLADLEAASRSKPGEATKSETKTPSNGMPKDIESVSKKIFGDR
jgi:hypothetical protein